MYALLVDLASPGLTLNCSVMVLSSYTGTVVYFVAVANMHVYRRSVKLMIIDLGTASGSVNK